MREEIYLIAYIIVQYHFQFLKLKTTSTFINFIGLNVIKSSIILFSDNYMIVLPKERTYFLEPKFVSPIFCKIS